MIRLGRQSNPASGSLGETSRIEKYAGPCKSLYTWVLVTFVCLDVRSVAAEKFRQLVANTMPARVEEQDNTAAFFTAQFVAVMRQIRRKIHIIIDCSTGALRW